MKKLFLFCLSLINLYSIELQTEIDTKFQSDFSESNIPITLSLTGQYSNNDIFSEFQVKGTEDELTLSKAYGEVSKNDFSYTFGRMPVSWGNAYIFNRMNALTGVNIINPEDKNSTLDGMKIKYISPNNSKTEAIIFNVNTADNYAIKQSFLIDNCEVQLNYIKREKESPLSPTEEKINDLIFVSPTEEKINDLIFEFKGDLVLGIWGQVARSFEYDKNYYVLGLDYSFSPFEKTLYLLWEGSYNERTELLPNYFRYNFSYNEWNALSGGLLLTEGEQVLTTTFNRKINDAVELNLSHVYLNKKLMKIESKNKIELQLKATF